MSAFTLRLNDSFKEKLDAKAKQQGKSLNQVVNDMLSFGSLVEDLTDDDSQVVIRHARGYKENDEVIVPSPKKLYR